MGGRTPHRYSVDFRLEPKATCTIAGNVRAEAGRDVAGAAVVASAGWAWLGRRTTTGSDGSYAIPDLTGFYYLDVAAEGYDDAPTREVSCEEAGSDGVVTRDFVLETGTRNTDPNSSAGSGTSLSSTPTTARHNGAANRSSGDGRTCCRQQVRTSTSERTTRRANAS